jgi:hypothetical protein
VFDLHVHTGPDLVERRLDDMEAVAAYQAAGYTGCVFKNHNEPTGGRAAMVRKHTGFAAYGSVVLNRPAGGLNPAAVEAELRLDARVVWMPTEDAVLHYAFGLPRGLSVGSDGHLSGGGGRTGPGIGYGIPPVRPESEAAIREILGLIADADAVLATGHLGGAECAWLLRQAKRYGITRTLLTHPSYSVPALSPAEIGELADLGTMVEITAVQLIVQPGMTAARLAQVAAAAGDRLVLSSDAGQVRMPFPPEAITRLIEALAAEGVDRGLLNAAASTIPARLVTA